MEIHPSQVPISRIFDVKGLSDAFGVINEILKLDLNKESGLRILMPKDQKVARRIGYTIVNELNKGLRMQRYVGNLKYFVYHYDSEHYAILLASEQFLSKLSS